MDARTSLSECMARFQRTLDDTEFETIFSALYRPAMAVACRLLPTVAAAEDAVQSTFLKVVRKRDSYDARWPFEPWFYRVLRNTCMDSLRRRAARPEEPGHQAAVQNLPGPAQPDPSLVVAIRGVPEGQRAVLELRIVHQMRFAEIGVALGISEEAAKKRGQRGLRALRKLYRAEQDASRIPTGIDSVAGQTP